MASRKRRRQEALHSDERAPASEHTRPSPTLRDLPSYTDPQDELVTNPVILLTQRMTDLLPPPKDGAHDPSLEALARLARSSAPAPRVSVAPRLLAPVAPVAVAAPSTLPPGIRDRQPSSIPALTVSTSSAPARPLTSPPRRRESDIGGRARGLSTVIVSATVGAFVALGMWTLRSGLDGTGSANAAGPFATAIASASDDKCLSPASGPATPPTGAVSVASVPESEKPVSFDALPRTASVGARTTSMASHRSANTVTARASVGSTRESSAPRPAVQRARGSPQSQVTAAVQRASSAARSCETGPQNGKVEVTFSPTGAVSSVALIKGFDDAGVNSCVLRSFGRVRVSAFEGDPITVRKTVSW